MSTETNCGRGASWCQSVWYNQPPLIDPVIIDGMAIGFLVWAAYMVLLTLYAKPRGIAVDWGVMIRWFIYFVGAGAAIGWLWP